MSCYSKKYVQKEPNIVKHTRKRRNKTTEMGTCNACNFCHYASLIHKNKRCGFTECDEVLWDHGILDVSITCT